VTIRKVVGAEDDERGRELDDDYAAHKVIVGSTANREVVETPPDPFSQSAEVFKTFRGVSPTFKKRATRAFQKVQQNSKETAGTKRIEQDAVDGYNLFGVRTPPYNLDYLAQLYTAGASPHYAAVDAKVANIVGLGYDFIDSHKTSQSLDRASGNEKKVERMRQKLAEAKNEIFEWLDNCNEEDTFDDIMSNVYTDYESTGNGYFEIGRDVSGRIAYIGHIPSVSMRVRKERDGFVQIVGNKAVYFRHFGKKTPNPISDEDPRPNEVIHLKKYSPTDSFYGVPDVIAAMQAVTGNELAARFNLDYFENKAVPRHVIVIKGGTLGSRSQMDIVEFFETGLKGKHHRTLFVPLPADEADKKTSFEMKPVEAGTQDASFVNYHKINLQLILMAEKVPMTKVGLAEGVNLAVARDADKTFKEQVCRPAQRRLEKKLGKVFSEKTDIFRFKLNELSLTDENTQSQIDERYLRMQTILPNEIRARWGKPGITGGDKVVDLKAQPGAEAASQGNRTRDANRSASATDSAGEGRNTKGDGRKTP
jgi:PBSX family phage portal protein